MYFVIEKPFRRVQASNGRFLLTCVLLAFVLIYLGASMWAGGGWEWRTWASSGSLSSDSVTRGKDYRFHVRQEICQKKGWKACDDVIDGKVNALIIGDSHAVDALNAFYEIFPEHNFSMSELGGCPPYHDIESITLPKHPDRLACKQLNVKRFDVEYLKQFDYIVINVLFGWYTVDHFEEYLLFLHKNDIKNVVVLGDYLVLETEIYEILNQHGYSSSKVMAQVNNGEGIDTPLRALVERFSYLFISKRSKLCTGGDCEVFDVNGIPFTYDQHHLSLEFAARIGTESKFEIDAYLGSLSTVAASAITPSVEFSIGSWGPQFTTVGVVPNKQLNGAMGVWVQLPSASEYGNFEVSFNDQPALVTTVGKDLVTAAISAALLTTQGEFPVKIKQLTTGRVEMIGVFTINAAD